MTGLRAIVVLCAGLALAACGDAPVPADPVPPGSRRFDDVPRPAAEARVENVFPRCHVVGLEGVPRDRVPSMQRVADDLLFGRLHPDFPLPLDIRRAPFEIRLTTRPVDEDATTIALIGDPARERTALRRRICRAYVERATRGLPAHDWFVAGFVDTLCRERGATGDPPATAAWRTVFETRTVQDFLTLRSRVSEPGGGAELPARERWGDAPAAFFAHLRSHEDPFARLVPLRYFETLADWASRGATAESTSADDAAARILAEKRAHEPARRAMRAAIAQVDMAEVAATWLGPKRESSEPSPR